MIMKMKITCLLPDEKNVFVFLSFLLCFFVCEKLLLLSKKLLS